MIRMIVLCALLFGTAAFAGDRDCKSSRYVDQQIQFSYGSFYSAYHCDFVERETQRIMENLGALNVDVFCTGGLPYSNSVFVRASYSGLVVDQNAGDVNACFETVDLKFFNDSCDLHEQIIDNVLAGLTVGEVDKRSTCYHSQGRLDYSIRVLR